MNLEELRHKRQAIFNRDKRAALELAELNRKFKQSLDYDYNKNTFLLNDFIKDRIAAIRVKSDQVDRCLKFELPKVEEKKAYKKRTRFNKTTTSKLYRSVSNDMNDYTHELRMSSGNSMYNEIITFYQVFNKESRQLNRALGLHTVNQIGNTNGIKK